MGTRAAQAAELLELETRYRSGALSEKELGRWYDLAVALFGGRGAPQRRSSRLPCEAKAELELGGKALGARVVELSHLGFTVLGAGVAGMTAGQLVTLRSISVKGEPIPLGITCKVVRRDRARGEPVVGLEINRNNGPAAYRLFSDKVYYPVYLDYLKRVASGAE